MDKKVNGAQVLPDLDFKPKQVTKPQLIQRCPATFVL